MRIMVDAVTPGNIPTTAQMVAGYLNGPYAWSAADWARFPHAVKVEISVRAADLRGHVLDVEAGANMPQPADAPAWVLARRAAGADPTVYCNTSYWPYVKQAFAAAGVAEPHYWIAKYDGVQALPVGAVAKQHSGNVPPGVDISSVADYWPGVDPVQGITPTSTTEDYVDIPAGTNVRRGIPCDGKTKICFQAGFGAAIDGHMWFIGDTKPGAGPQYLGSSPQAVHIDSDKPGPITVPNNCRVVEVELTCAVPFTAWCAVS